MQLSDASVMLCVVILQHRRGTNKAGGRERWMMVLGGAVMERKREKNGSKMMREQESAMTKAWKSLLLLVMRITSGEIAVVCLLVIREERTCLNTATFW